MRGRPKKGIDTDFVLQLHSQNLSARQIAAQLGVSRMTINRILCQSKGGTKIVAQNSPTSITGGTKIRVAQNSQGGTKFPYVIGGVSCKPSPPQIIPSSIGSGSSTYGTPTTSPLRSCATTITFDAHHASYTLPSYNGNQPSSLRSFSPKNHIVYVHELDNAVILAYTKCLRIWINQAKGSTPEEIQHRTKGRARAELGAFIAKHGLKADLNTIQKTADEHLTVENPEVNEILFELFESDPKIAAKMGWVAGDSSHPDKNELKGPEGMHTARNIREIFEMLPNAIADLAESQRMYSDSLKNYQEQNNAFADEIRTHRETMKKIGESLDELKLTMQAIRESLKK